MKRTIWLLALVGAILLSGSPLWAEDEFYVVAGGRGVGTKITSLPYRIINPGFYYLTGNLSRPTPGNGITVDCDHVTIDLMGFSLTGPPDHWTDVGIFITSRQNVEIRNGTMTYWGICIKEIDGLRHRVFNIRAQCYDEAIRLNGQGHIVKGCTVLNTHQGIVGANIISGCTLVNCKTTGIFGGEVIRGNYVYGCGVGIFTNGGSVIGNTVLTATGQTGIQLPGGAGYPVIVDQNSVGGQGTPYTGADAGTVWGKNAGLP